MTLWERVQEYRQSRRRIPVEEVSEQDLHEKVHVASVTVDMMQTEGWKAFSERGRDLILRLKDQVCGMGTEDFAGPAGLQAKGIVVGAQMLLNLVGQIVGEGLEAEKKLRELGLARSNGKPRASMVK